MFIYFTIYNFACKLLKRITENIVNKYSGKTTNILESPDFFLEITIHHKYS